LGPRGRGYTVVELVIVLVLMGILAANALPRFFAASTFDEMGYADSLLGALRYGHKLALASRCDTRVAITATGYALYQREIVDPGFDAAFDCPSGALTRPVNRPGGSTWTGATPSGVAVGALDLYFDGQGRPRDTPPSGEGTGNLLTVAPTLSVGARSITLEPESGYAHGG
jgi:MSHA pilin protein MshC